MAILDKGSESRQIALGRIVTILAEQSDGFLADLADSLDRRLNPTPQTTFRLVLHPSIEREHGRAPA